MSDRHLSRHRVGMAAAMETSEALVVRVGEAISAAERVRPRVTVLDIEIPTRAAFHIAQDLVDRMLTQSLVIYTDCCDDRVPVAGVVAGACAVVPKSDLNGALGEAVQRANAGQSVRPHVSIDGLVEAAGMVAPDDMPVLAMLVHGTSTAEIGEVLGVHERELATRRRRMLNALLADWR
jgi:DNA-binding NarL/FixJ family response regulator